ncbi:MAG: hypothetical protein ACRC9K_21330, partial [Afipia sp.]
GRFSRALLKRSRMRRLRARFAPVAPGRPGLTVRANYVALPFAAGRGEDESRRKPAGSGVD